MLRTDEDPELLVFDPVIRFFHWLTLFLVATIFVLAFSIDFASSKEEAVAPIQLHRSFWRDCAGRDARSARLAPILALPQLPG
jgi:Ni,Fe-hydrogenase I cytochrome b subunit